VCDLGWAGDDCAAATNPLGGGCAGNCSGYGACLNGTCFCDPGWMGPACDVRIAEAEPCAFNCSSRGMCVNSTCWCDPGFAGSYCELFGPSGTPMPLELFNTSAPLLCGGDAGCSGHGSCEGGVCYCDAMYTGAACERLEGILTRACPSDCSAHGTLFFTLVTSLSLKLSDTRVYKPQIRARLGTTAHFCKLSDTRVSRAS